MPLAAVTTWAGQPGERAGVGRVLDDRVVQSGGGLALALEQVDLRLHQRRAPRDRHELVRELGELLGGDAAAGREPLRAHGELVRRGGAAGLVPGGLGLRLVDEELDLLDLALEGGCLIGQARGEIRGGSDIPAGRRLLRALGRGAGFRSDLSPPAS